MCDVRDLKNGRKQRESAEVFKNSLSSVAMSKNFDKCSLYAKCCRSSQCFPMPTFRMPMQCRANSMQPRSTPKSNATSIQSPKSYLNSASSTTHHSQTGRDPLSHKPPALSNPESQYALYSHSRPSTPTSLQPSQPVCKTPRSFPGGAIRRGCIS